MSSAGVCAWPMAAPDVRGGLLVVVPGPRRLSHPFEAEPTEAGHAPDQLPRCGHWTLSAGRSPVVVTAASRGVPLTVAAYRVPDPSPPSIPQPAPMCLAAEN